MNPYKDGRRVNRKGILVAQDTKCLGSLGTQTSWESSEGWGYR